MSTLPSAEVQFPACGACGGETVTYDVDDDFTCEDCQLSFDRNTLAASFSDPNAEPCGRQCDNSWHGDHKIRQGIGFDCGPCKLPAGHKTRLHWTGCQQKNLT